MDDPSLVHRFRGLHDAVTSVAFSPGPAPAGPAGARQLAAASKDKSVLLWTFKPPQSSGGGGGDFDAGKAFRFSGHSDAVYDVAFSPSGRLIASASRDKTVRVWVNSARGESSDFRGHSAGVRSVCFSPGTSGADGGGGGQFILTGSDDKSVKVWTVQRHKFVTSFGGHTNWVRCARYSPDNGSIIASCSDDKTIRVHDERTGGTVHVFHDSKGFAHHLAFHPSGTCIGVGTSDKKVKIYDIRMRKLQQLYSSHDGAVSQVSFHQSGNYLVSASHDGSLKMFDLLEARPIYDLRGHDKTATCVAFSPAGAYLASGGGDSQVFVWRTNLEALERRLGRDQVNRENVDRDAEVVAERMESVGRQVAKADALAEKVQNRHPSGSQVTFGEDKENYSSKTSSLGRTSDLKSENEALVQENHRLKEELGETKEKVDTLMETVILMEKRISLLEEQVKLSQSLQEMDLASPSGAKRN